jgi:hypothetical protein
MTALTYGPRLSFTLSRTLTVLALVFALISSARSDDTAPVAKPVPVPSPANPTMPMVAGKSLSSDEIDRINASARGLAGETGSNSWESTKEWKDYSSALDGNWNYLKRIRLNAMSTWGNSELSGLRDQTSTVFYPFSGPDVLYADTLFPDSKVLLMAGLEPIGSIPDLAKIQADGKLGPYLAQVKTSLFTILAASFFKTKDMKNDFNNQLVDGLMPAMIVFLARQGYHIDDIQYVTLDHEGGLHPHAEKEGASGVQITYDGGRTLLYFQVNLSDDGQGENPGFVNLMHRLAPGVTYLKAASYLLYEDYFSKIRNAILENSVGVVEDDSGIPLKDFKASQWDVIPYGDYTGPIALFKDKDQPDLHEYYKKTPHNQLAFGSGYKFAASVSSLLVAKKK